MSRVVATVQRVIRRQGMVSQLDILVFFPV
jgi:hypothetical protein